MAPSGARARFQSDLKIAAERDISNVLGVQKGEMEEEFTFTFDHPGMASKPKIHAMLQDLADYPEQCMYIVYTTEDVPAEVAKELDASMHKTRGMGVFDMLNNLSHRLHRCLEPDDNVENESYPVTDEDADDNDNDLIDIQDSDEDDIPFEYGDEDDFDFDVDNLYSNSARKIHPSVMRRIRQDFRIVRDSGFKVGRIYGFEHANDDSIVSMSVRVNKLHLPQITREAWDLSDTDYIVLLIRYSGDYLTYEDIMRKPAQQSRLKFRLRKCSKYRPTLPQAIEALSSEPGKQDSFNLPNEKEQTGPDYSLLCIGESLDMFLDKELVPMMELRKLKGVSWDAAKRMHSKMMVSVSSGQEAQSDEKQQEAEEEGDNEAQLPPILAVDHLSSSTEISFPLVAMQFALRYLVRCADYCMICHEKVKGNFESVKPYVCGNSLCLFQYMSLGFGPSIDYEIINQPYVVDLLASFCYSSLLGHWGKVRMREFPTGLSISVPNIRQTRGPAQSSTDSQDSKTHRIGSMLLTDAAEISLDWEGSIVVFNAPSDHNGWKTGRWVVVCTPLHPTRTSRNPNEQQEWILHHGRIEWKINQSMKLQIVSRHVVPALKHLDSVVLQPGPNPRQIPGYLVPYGQKLDDLPELDKAFSMTLLLATTPSIIEMRSYLMGGQNRKLATWDRITPAAMTLLRWIVASNRSYIVQVDRCPGQDDNDPSIAKLVRDDERISGVDDWIQFRLAQGSPEKEALFQEALKDVQKPFRTLVAWHGSPLPNWHSIIRHGLDYSEIAHGRAFGHGVYFSREFDYSQSYASTSSTLARGQVQTWPQSELNVTAAISLSELINLPEEFVQSKPFFVVQHCHWIQCRYLFVRTWRSLISRAAPEDSSKEMNTFIQDPSWETKGPKGSLLRIPRIAIPSANETANKSPMTSLSIGGHKQSGDSDEEDVEDIKFLLDDDDDDDDNVRSTSQAKKDAPGDSRPVDSLPPASTLQEQHTDFRPGTLDFSHLRLLTPPSYATEAAQRAIGRELKKLQKVQSTTPLHELGWYIDFSRVNNMFQWIVELHSFDADLPLAKDMKTANLTSIVLEVRFLREFPMSPPFVRVVRPRFLPFMDGGGGHVTAGGAMCMELLTATGWTPANSMESVLLQVRLAMCSLEPRPARLLRKPSQATTQYGVSEAIDAYMRATQTHGWKAPPDLIEASTEMRRE
ncbi:hypothetical protein F4809DRAFT_650008 [Biscogniauxia mediterranea]|nr:hypothetical protein F4809DRAFT_650008 [Biscogniauxia mediterranea]